MKLASILTVGIVSLALTVGSAEAGTKYQTNIVPANADMNGLETDPTLSNKSKVKITDTGQFQAKVDGVTDALGALVTTDGSFDDKTAPALNGDEYLVIIGGTFVALGVGFQFNLPMELKGGKGKAKIDASSLFGLIPPGTLRSTQQTTVEVYGPIGPAAVAACATNLDGGGFVVSPDPNPCLAGDRVGVGGIQLQ